ncbi:cell adhesion molecule 1-like [Atheta coriaria]|uniref:cell adhesion molecule 1-like n=1 Tax=Dalotia coriaria TaxID=877792 RepID=UPI0031F33EDA
MEVSAAKDFFLRLLVVNLLGTFYGVSGLKHVELLIHPRVVNKGESSTLSCVYDLEGAQLYTVKWYRGRHEFYRYTPSEHPATKVFLFAGAHVDLETSDEHQVVLRKVGFNLSGNFSCEVTTEAPFSTAVVSKDMLVVVLPNAPPTLITEKAFYMAGDELRANCTTLPSRPAATISYFINNNAVCQTCETKKHADGELLWSELSLDLPIFPSHFDNGGRLVLRCEAQILGMYNQSAELRLDSAKDPVPERVTFPNGGSPSPHVSILGKDAIRLGIFIYLVLIFR